jgi:thioredoxin 1
MASQNVVQFTDTNFESEVLASEQPVLVDFWAEWCGPCKMLTPIIDDLAEEYKGRAKIGKVDTDSNRNTAMRFSISAIPTVLVFKKGQLVQRLQGFRAKKDFKAVLDNALGAPATA